MFTRILAIVKKEFRQIIRDKRSLILIFFYPVFMLILFGYALNFDVTHIRMGIYDLEKSEFSREFIKTFNSSEYFDIVKYINNPDDVNHSLDDKSVQCVVTIPADFSDKFYSKEKTDVQFLVDGVNGNTATIIMNYVNVATLGFSQKISADILARAGGNIKMPVNIQGVFWYNPDLKTTEFLIPGLIATILIVICVTLTAVSIVREKRARHNRADKCLPCFTAGVNTRENHSVYFIGNTYFYFSSFPWSNFIRSTNQGQYFIYVHRYIVIPDSLFKYGNFRFNNC